MIKVLVCGAAGNMGKEVVRAISKEDDLTLVGAVDLKEVGKDAGEIAGIGKIFVLVTNSLDEIIKKSKPQVMIDFTTPEAVRDNLNTALKSKLPCVVGTTGFDALALEEVKRLCSKYKVGAIICPNFALGAVLMMEFAKLAAKHFDHLEIIELHHDQKKDAPSGTAIKTAQMVSEVKGHLSKSKKEKELIKGVRGGRVDNICIHSVRLPGLVAHQEVIFGGRGQTLTIRHDSTSRESFMPGVIMAIRYVRKLKGLTYGLENLL